MNESKYMLFFLVFLGVFNGLLMGIYLLIRSRRKNLPAFFLGCLLLALSIRIGKTVFASFNPALPKIYLQIGLSACFLIGPALYYFVRSGIEKRSSIPREWKLQIASLLAIIVTFGSFYTYQAHPKLWNNYLVYFIYAVWVLFVIAAGFVLKSQIQRFFARKSPDTPPLDVTEKWLLAIYAGNVLICFSFQCSLYLGSFYNICFSGALVFSSLLYALVFVLFYRKKTTDLFETVPIRTPAKKIDSSDAARWPSCSAPTRSAT